MAMHVPLPRTVLLTVAGSAICAAQFGVSAHTILYYEEAVRYAVLKYQGAGTLYLVVHPHLSAILAGLLCAAAWLAYTVGAMALSGGASWSRPLIVSATIPGTIGALLACAIWAASVELRYLISVQLILAAPLALALPSLCFIAVRRAEVTAWLAKS
jgi:hypothetical protein